MPRRQPAISRRASPGVTANGFSHSTGTPRRTKYSASCTCVAGGVQSSTPSSSPLPGKRLDIGEAAATERLGRGLRRLGARVGDTDDDGLVEIGEHLHVGLRDAARTDQTETEG